MCFTNSLLVNLQHPNIDSFKCERIPDGSLDHVILEPSWSWIQDVKPYLEHKTDFCTLPHHMQIVSGELAIRFENGNVKCFTNADEYFTIEEPHEAWVVGKDNCVFTHFEFIDLSHPIFKKVAKKPRNRKTIRSKANSSRIQKKIKRN